VMNVREARKVLLSDCALGGAIFDVMLPDGSGLDLLEEIRPHRPLLPAMLLTGFCEPALVNRAFRVRAQYLVKPPSSGELLAFVRFAFAGRHADDDRVREAVGAFAMEHALTPRECEVVGLATQELTRKDIAPRLGISLTTLDGYIASILRKSRQSALQEIARQLRRSARSAE